MKLMITGATGQLGSLVVKEVLKRTSADHVAVSVRNPEKAQALKALGVDVRQGDFDQPEGLVETFKGIDRLLIISANEDNATRIRQHQAAVAAAKAAGVGFVVYTSLADAPNSSLGLAEVHRVTEAAIVASGIPYAFLRNNWYLENEGGNFAGAKAGAPWVTNYGDGKVGFATRSEYAEAAAVVLTGTEVSPVIYELSGARYNQDELAAAVGEVLGRDIQVIQLADEAYGAHLAQVGLPDFLIPMFIDMGRAIREGALDVVSQDLEKLVGHPQASLVSRVRQLLEV